MSFKLNYDDLVILDAENLAEAGIKAAYETLRPRLAQYVSQPEDVEEIIDNDAPRYMVKHRHTEYVIYSPEMEYGQGRSWGLATHALFSIVNNQLTRSDHRFYAINGGNELGGMFLTTGQCESAKLSLPNKTDWPYTPTLEHPWNGQFHD